MNIIDNLIKSIGYLDSYYNKVEARADTVINNGDFLIKNSFGDYALNEQIIPNLPSISYSTFAILNLEEKIILRKRGNNSYYYTQTFETMKYNEETFSWDVIDTFVYTTKLTNYISTATKELWDKKYFFTLRVETGSYGEEGEVYGFKINDDYTMTTLGGSIKFKVNPYNSNTNTNLLYVCFMQEQKTIFARCRVIDSQQGTFQVAVSFYIDDNDTIQKSPNNTEMGYNFFTRDDNENYKAGGQSGISNEYLVCQFNPSSNFNIVFTETGVFECIKGVYTKIADAISTNVSVTATMSDKTLLVTSSSKYKLLTYPNYNEEKEYTLPITPSFLEIENNDIKAVGNRNFYTELKADGTFSGTIDFSENTGGVFFQNNIIYTLEELKNNVIYYIYKSYTPVDLKTFGYIPDTEAKLNVLNAPAIARKDMQINTIDKIFVKKEEL